VSFTQKGEMHLLNVYSISTIISFRRLGTSFDLHNSQAVLG